MVSTVAVEWRPLRLTMTTVCPRVSFFQSRTGRSRGRLYVRIDCMWPTFGLEGVGLSWDLVGQAQLGVAAEMIASTGCLCRTAQPRTVMTVIDPPATTM